MSPNRDTAGRKTGASVLLAFPRALINRPTMDGPPLWPRAPPEIPMLPAAVPFLVVLVSLGAAGSALSDDGSVDAGNRAIRIDGSAETVFLSQRRGQPRGGDSDRRSLHLRTEDRSCRPRSSAAC